MTYLKNIFFATLLCSYSLYAGPKRHEPGADDLQKISFQRVSFLNSAHAALLAFGISDEQLHNICANGVREWCKNDSSLIQIWQHKEPGDNIRIRITKRPTREGSHRITSIIQQPTPTLISRVTITTTITRRLAEFGALKEELFRALKEGECSSDGMQSIYTMPDGLTVAAFTDPLTGRQTIHDFYYADVAGDR